MTSEKIEKLVSTIIAAFGVGTLVFLIWMSLRSFGSISDFPEYYAPARLVVDGRGAAGFSLPGLTEAQHSLFPSLGQRVIPLYVPPQGLALFSSIGLLSPALAAVVWKALLVTALVCSIVLLVRTFSLNYKQTCYLVASLCLSDACYEALRIDQLATVLLLAFSLAIYFLEKKRDFRAGIWLCLLILKPQQILPFLAYLAGTRRWRVLAAFTGAVVFLTAVSYWQIGSDGFHNYVALLGSPESASYQQPQLTPTFRGQLLRLFPDAAGTIFGVTAAIYAACLAFALFLGNRYRHSEKVGLFGVLAVMPMGLVASLHCHTYDLLLLAPALLLLYLDKVVSFGSVYKLAVMLGGMTFMLPIAVDIQYNYLLKGGQFNIWFFELLIFAVAVLVRCFKLPSAKN